MARPHPLLASPNPSQRSERRQGRAEEGKDSPAVEDRDDEKTARQRLKSSGSSHFLTMSRQARTLASCSSRSRLRPSGVFRSASVPAASAFGGGLMSIRLPPDHQLLITINSLVVAALAKETSQSTRFCVRADNPPTNNSRLRHDSERR